MSETALPDKSKIRYLNAGEKTERMIELEARFGERIEDWLWRIRWQEKKSVQWIAQTAGVSYGTLIRRRNRRYAFGGMRPGGI